jgi:GNAT superfamily N-acetyltransferase
MEKAMETRRDQASTFDPERIIPLNEENKPVVNAFIKERWFSTDMIIHGEIVDLSKAEGFLLLRDGRISALVTYRIRGNLCDILSLDSLSECHGVGSALIERVAKTAKSRGCCRIVVVTTNDNLNAIRFYQKRGFDMTRLFYNALEKSRMIKPEIPLIGENGIPLRHEIEFERKI